VNEKIILGMSEVVRKKKKIEDGCVPIQVFVSDLEKAQTEYIPEACRRPYFTEIYELMAKRT